jgi:hypothetical protein
MYADKHNSVSEICKTLGITRMTLWRYVRAGEREGGCRRLVPKLEDPAVDHFRSFRLLPPPEHQTQG